MTACGKYGLRNYTTELNMKLDFQSPSEPTAIQGCNFYFRLVTFLSLRKDRVPESVRVVLLLVKQKITFLSINLALPWLPGM